jgi:hypothetical protein
MDIRPISEAMRIAMTATGIPTGLGTSTEKDIPSDSGTEVITAKTGICFTDSAIRRAAPAFSFQ